MRGHQAQFASHGRAEVVEGHVLFSDIARLIGEEHQRHSRYITAHEISTRLLEDGEARVIIIFISNRFRTKRSLHECGGDARTRAPCRARGLMLALKQIQRRNA